MKLFLVKILIFLTICLGLFLIVLLNNKNSLNLPISYPNKEYFKLFKKHYENKKSINLILGASITRDLIIPEGLGKNWFSFTNNNQNIYESYIFLNHYKDSVQIDSIIIGIQPFDFPFSYIKDRTIDRPRVNGNFDILKKDSITTIMQNPRKYMKIQLMKEKIFIRITGYLTFESESKIKEISVQGFSSMRRKGVDLNVLFKESPWLLTAHNDYFKNVNLPPNMKYINLFNHLADSLGIKVIYLLTPKSKHYFLAMKEKGYDLIWLETKNHLADNLDKVWDYENFNTDNTDFHFFVDETHSSIDGAIYFTKIIKNRLTETQATITYP